MTGVRVALSNQRALKTVETQRPCLGGPEALTKKRRGSSSEIPSYVGMEALCVCVYSQVGSLHLGAGTAISSSLPASKGSRLLNALVTYIILTGMFEESGFCTM